MLRKHWLKFALAFLLGIVPAALLAKPFGTVTSVEEVPLNTDNLSFFAATTSAQLFGVISDETGGSGVLVGNASPAFTTQISTPAIVTASGALTITPAAGSNLNIVLSTTGDFTVNTDDLVVDTSAGFVGIAGATAPAEALQVQGNIRIRHSGNQILRWTEAGVTDRGIMGFVAGNADLVIRLNGASSFADGTEYFRIGGTTGKVGIGTASPDELLHVNGAIKVIGTGTYFFDVDADTTVPGAATGRIPFKDTSTGVTRYIMVSDT